jgi:V/A-type H+/Na+-transporting ATPase subunit I
MGVLRPEKMSRIALLGLRDDETRILTLLHDLRIAQIEPVSPESMAELAPERGTEVQRAIADEALRFRGLVNALPPVERASAMSFETVDDVLRGAATVTIDDEVGKLKREDDQLQTELKGIHDQLELLRKIGFYSDRLEYLESPNFLAFYAEADPEALALLRSTLPAEADAQFLLGPADKKTVRFLVVLRRAGADALSRAAQNQSIRLVAIPSLHGTPADEIVTFESRRVEIVARRLAIAERLRAIARDWYPTVAAVDEALTIENRKLEVFSRLGAGREVFALEAWVPTKDVPRLQSIVEAATRGRVFLSLVPTREEPPTKMSNPGGIRRFEFFIRFYSLPQASEFDPTLTFAIIFPIFFGIMLGDWGYGLTILLICIWMIRGFPGARYLPRAGRNFVKLIMGPKGMQQLAYALLPGCAIAIGLGFLFDEFFGVHVLQTLFGITPIADPLRNVGSLLLIAGFFGLAMVTYGFALGALKEYFHHHPRGAIGKVGGIAFAWGVAGYGLQVLHYHAILPHLNPILVLSWVGLALGIVFLIVAEGPIGFLSVIDITSHILSYTRLVGILLASVVLALVINDIANLAWHGLGPILGLLIAVVVVIGGQAFNVILGVFEPGIQGARLIFVEHFSKFYTGNGKPFHPFGVERRHTVSSVGPGGTPTFPLVRGPQNGN